MAPLSAPGRQHAASAFALHAAAKPVRLAAAADVGLEGAFGHRILGPAYRRQAVARPPRRAGALRAKANSQYRRALDAASSNCRHPASARFLVSQSVAWKSFPSCGIVRGFPGREVTGSDFFRKVLASSCSLFCTPFSRAGSVRGDEILRSQHGISPLTLSGLWKSLWMSRWISFLRYRVSA